MQRCKFSVSERHLNVIRDDPMLKMYASSVARQFRFKCVLIFFAVMKLNVRSVLDYVNHANDMSPKDVVNRFVEDSQMVELDEEMQGRIG